VEAFYIGGVRVSSTINKCAPFPLYKCEEAIMEVKNLRTRIFQNAKKGNTIQVAALQRILIHSLAIRKVTMGLKKGWVTGVDGQRYKDSAPRNLLYNKFKEVIKGGFNNYNPLPNSFSIYSIYIPKPSPPFYFRYGALRIGKIRPLGISAIIDRCLQTIVLNSLEPAFEPSADFRSYGFRPGRGVNDAIARIYRTLRTKQSS
jgi:RNA-directed DNA polymerase